MCNGENLNVLSHEIKDLHFSLLLFNSILEGLAKCNNYLYLVLCAESSLTGSRAPKAELTHPALQTTVQEPKSPTHRAEAPPTRSSPEGGGPCAERLHLALDPREQLLCACAECVSTPPPPH